ncbi:MAG: nucleotide exchange factor GrpE [bacterium]|nr:nucleotide exchange factor GrpE [bacterium]
MKQDEEKLENINICDCGTDCDCLSDENTFRDCHCQEHDHKKEKKKKQKGNGELEEAKQMILELQSKLMYTQADAINYRKRKDEETANILKYANQDLLLDLVDMIENLDRASSVKVESEESKKIQTGITMVSNQFKDILKKYGVIEIEALGYPFDSDYMEAMMVDSDPEKPNDMVLAVLMKGYKYKDRVLKHAVVKVNQVEEINNNEDNENNENSENNDEKGND